MNQLVLSPVKETNRSKKKENYIMSTNFLPEFQIEEVRPNMLKCLKREEYIEITQEEKVRQRVLNWLISIKKFPINQIRLEYQYTWHSDDRKHIQPDIELLDTSLEEVELVIECKKRNELLSESVLKQANEYAIKSGSKFIWITDGEKHRFFEKNGRNVAEIYTLKILNARYKWTPATPKPPEILNDSTFSNYLTNHPDIKSRGYPDDETKRKLMAFHKLIFNINLDPLNDLPFSYKGVHILEDRGVMFMSSNNKGGEYSGWYRGYLTCTSDQLEVLTIGITFHSKANEVVKGAQVCVDRLIRRKSTHSLQLNLTDENCKMKKNNRFWEITHSGCRGGRFKNIEKMKDVIKESEADHLIDPNDGVNKRIKLGKLYLPDECNWNNSKELIANLLHYGMIRFKI